MLVKVYLNSLGDKSVLNNQNMLELCEGATLRQALRKLKVPTVLNRLPLVAINHRRAKLSDVLKDGDSITFAGYHVGG